MQPIIESMERRTLLSASVIEQDLLALKADANQANADLKAGLKVASADLKAIKAATAASHPLKTQKQALTLLAKQFNTAVATFKKNVTVLINPGTKAGNRLVSTLRALQAHQSYKNLGKVDAAFAALQNVFSTQAIAANEASSAALVTALNANLDTLVTSVPTSQSAVGTAKAHFSNDQTTLTKDMAIIQAAVATVGRDLP